MGRFAHAGPYRRHGEIASATVDARRLDLIDCQSAGEGVLLLNYAGVPEAGFALTLVVRGAGAVIVTLDDSTLGLPQTLDFVVPPRPPDTRPSPLYRRDSTDVRRRVTL